MPGEATFPKFVRALLAGGIARREGANFVLPDGVRAPIGYVKKAVEDGGLESDGMTCRSNEATRSWLKRDKLDSDAAAARDRIVVVVDDREVNLAESPLSRLAAGKAPFLEPHHVEAGERVRKLVERAQLLPRVTMTYSGSRVAGRQAHKNDIPDMAADARRHVGRIYEVLPRDCAGVVIDVCGFLKGLQDVEWERGWPRRSAKLVLRIGLEHLAAHYGMSSHVMGPATGRHRSWLADGGRPTSWD